MSHIKILCYISNILYPKYNSFWFLFYMYTAYYKIYKRSFIYNFKTFPSKILLEHAKKVPNCFNDINNCIIVNKNNIYSNDVILKLVDSNNIHNYRYVYVLPTKECSKDTLIISETFFTNFNTTTNVKLYKIDNKSFIFADEIHISLISCPYDVPSGVIDSLLEGYFKTPKLICVNDIIEINIKLFAENIFYLNNKINLLENVYFKCNKVILSDKEVNGCYFCVIGETAVKQCVNVQSFIPRRTEIPVEIGKNEIFNNLGVISMLPYGFENNFREIERAVMPFIKKRKIKLLPVFLIQGEAGSGKHILVETLAFKYGFNFYKVDNYELTANVYAQNETKLNNVFFMAKMAAPCVLCIQNFENFGKNNDGQYDERITSYFIDSLTNLFGQNEYPVILFCLTKETDIPSDLRRSFLEIFEIDAPRDIQRKQILEWILKKDNINIDNVDLNDIGNKTHGFFFEDLKTLVHHAQNYSKNDKIKSIQNDHFLKAIDHMQSNYNESIGAPKVPKVQWSDVGGLNDVKQEIIKTIDLPLKHPDLLKNSGLKRSGILLFGPPGTGKTLIAKAVATECSLCFLSVKGPELLNMYVGQSEQNVRDVFERARQASPCIIFFDELDSLAPNRGISGDSGGVMDRVVSQLLAEMDGLNESGTVFVIGATNRPDLIDPALLRPGRFDRLLYVGPCTDFESKISVLRALTKRFCMSEDCTLENVVKICPENITGADFYGICSNAWSSAARRLIEKIESNEMNKEKDIKSNKGDFTYKDVIVNFEDFEMSIQNIKPSISPEDLKYFEKLKLELGSNTL